MTKPIPTRKRNKAVDLVLRDGLSQVEVARRVGVHPQTVYLWVREARRGHQSNMTVARAPEATEDKVAVEATMHDTAISVGSDPADIQMRVEVQQLQQERDLLRQVIVHLVKENFVLASSRAEVA